MPGSLASGTHCIIEVVAALVKAVIVYMKKIQQDATVCRYLFTAKLLYMFRGVHRTHHQEYIKL